jgi:hypothetical protein
VSGGNIEAVIRKARGNDLLRLRKIERAADERFRDLGMDAIADGQPAPLEHWGLQGMTLMTFRDVPWNCPYYERLGFRVVDEAQLTGGLRELQAHEAALGLNRWRRVAMRRRVDGS